MDCRVSKAKQVLKGSREPPVSVPKGTPAKLGCRVSKVSRVSKVRLALLEPQACRVSKVRLDYKDLRVIQEFRVKWVPPVKPVYRVFRESRDPWDNRVRLAFRVSKVRLVPKEFKGKPDYKEFKGKPDYKVLKEPKVRLGFRAFRVRQEFKEYRVKPVFKGLPVIQEFRVRLG